MQPGIIIMVRTPHIVHFVIANNIASLADKLTSAQEITGTVAQSRTDTACVGSKSRDFCALLNLAFCLCLHEQAHLFSQASKCPSIRYCVNLYRRVVHVRITFLPSYYSSVLCTCLPCIYLTCIIPGVFHRSIERNGGCSKRMRWTVVIKIST